MKWNWHFAGYGLAALIVLGLLVAYHRSEVANARAEAGQQAREEANKQSEQKFKDLQDQAARDKVDNAAKIDALTKTVASLKTPTDKLDWVIAHLPNQPGQPPITINVPKDPNQPATINVPQTRVPEVTDAVEGCDKCKLNLASTTSQLTYSQQQQQLLSNQLLNVSKERDDWKSAAKGGSWLKRFGRAAKYLVIGGAIGYIAAKH